MTLKKDGFARVTNAQANQTIHADMKGQPSCQLRATLINEDRHIRIRRLKNQWDRHFCVRSEASIRAVELVC